MTQSTPLGEDPITVIARLESVVEVFGGTAREVPKTVKGRDGTGMIAVVVRNTELIADLSIDYHWHDDLDPVELGSVLTAAIDDARNEFLQGAEDYAAHHRNGIGGVDADRARERTEGASRSMLATSLFVAPASVDDLAREVLQKADTLDDLAHGIKSLVRGGFSETSKPTSINPTIVKRAGGQVTRIGTSPQWARNAPTAIFVQRFVDAVVTADDPPIAAGNDDVDVTVLHLLSTLYSLPGKKE